VKYWKKHGCRSSRLPLSGYCNVKKIIYMETQLFSHSQVMNFSEKVDYSTEGIVSKRVIQKDTGNVTLFAFDMGQQLSEHSAPYDALVQVLEGRAEVMINRQPFHLSAGQSVIMPANIPHAVNAVERFKMLLTMIKG
jgi:quercetin dioxygenase-like cupin family protein